MEMFDAVIPASPVKDTVKVVSKEGFVSKTLDWDLSACADTADIQIRTYCYSVSRRYGKKALRIR